MADRIGVDRFTYETEEGWDKIPSGYEFPDASGVTVDADDNVYILNRGPHPVIVLDKDGNFVRSWGEGEFDQRAHGIHCSPDGFIYTVNDSQPLHQEVHPRGEAGHGHRRREPGGGEVERHSLPPTHKHGCVPQHWRHLRHRRLRQ